MVTLGYPGLLLHPGVGSGVFGRAHRLAYPRQEPLSRDGPDQIINGKQPIVGSAPRNTPLGLGGEFPGVKHSQGRLTYSIGRRFPARRRMLSSWCAGHGDFKQMRTIYSSMGTNGVDVGGFAVPPNFSANNNLVHFSPGSAGANRFSSTQTPRL